MNGLEEKMAYLYGRSVPVAKVYLHAMLLLVINLHSIP